MKKVILSGILACLCYGLHAQPLIPQGAIYHQLTTRHGLSSNKIVAVLQDKEGFYWIATQDGLNRFDGTNIKIFRHVKNDNNSLSNNHCTDMLEDKFGNIWIATLNGLNCYDRKQEKFKRYYFSHPAFAANRVNWIRSMAEDKEGNIWAASFGLWKINSRRDQIHYYSDNISNPRKSFIQNVNNIEYDPRLNGIWCNSEDGMIFFDISHSAFYHRLHNPYQWDIVNLKDYLIYTIDPKHNLWFYHPDKHTLFKAQLPGGKLQNTGIRIPAGINKIQSDMQGRIWIMLYNKHPILFSPETLERDSSFLQHVHFRSPVSQIVQLCYNDKKGNYWLCSPEGISVYDPDNQSKEYLEFTRVKEHHKAYTSGMFNGFSIQSKNDLWLYNHTGLYHVIRDSNRMRKMSEPLFLQGVSSVLAAGDSLLFITVANAIYRYHIGQRKIDKKAPGKFSHRTNIIMDKYKNIWVGSWTDGVYKFDKNLKLLHHFIKYKDGLHHTYIIGMYYDEQSDSVFTGFNGGQGYACIHAINNGITNHIIPLPKENERNVANTVNCFFKDSKVTLWIGTFGGGLFFKQKGSNSFSHISQTDGLKSNFINSILEDANGNTWISTSSGINILTNEEHTIINPGNEIELPSNDFFQNLRFMDDSSLAAYDNKKLIIYHPSRMLMKEKPGKILVSDFRIFGKSHHLLSNGKPIRLRYKQNFFSFEFSLLKTDPEREVPYAYKLEGFDREWVRLDKLHIANYTNVPPGNYIFKVKAASNNGEWVHFSKDIMLTIVPPFWKTGWFIMAVVLLISIIAWSLYHYRINQLKRVFAVRNKISHDLHDEIGSTLSGVALLSELTQQKLQHHQGREANKYLRQITRQAQDMIQKMNDIVWAINPQNDSLEKVVNKLHAYAVNICKATKTQFHLSFDEKMKSQTLDMQIRENIYLLSKEAINNAVKYSGANHLYFSLHHLYGKNWLVIKDDGCGFDISVPTEGNGLKNMKSRATVINGNLNIRSEKGSGTLIELKW